MPPSLPPYRFDQPVSHFVVLVAATLLGFICSSANRNANFGQNGEMASLIFTVCLCPPRVTKHSRVKQGKVIYYIAARRLCRIQLSSWVSAA